MMDMMSDPNAARREDRWADIYRCFAWCNTLKGINMVYLVIVLYISGLRSSSSCTWYRNFVCKQNMLCGNNLLQKYNLRAMYVYIVTVTLFYIWNTGSRLCILERLASLFLIVSSQQYVHLSRTRTMVVKCVNQKALSD